MRARRTVAALALTARSLVPGSATTGGTDAVWFSAGIDNETHGPVGTFKAAR